jgi:hypothetical protein
MISRGSLRCPRTGLGYLVMNCRPAFVLALSGVERDKPNEPWPTNSAARRRWLGDRESNPDRAVQSRLSYH